MHSDDELKELAKNIFCNNVFTSHHIRKGDEGAIPMIFLPIALINDKQRQQMIDDKIAMFYEFYDKAFPRSVNGYPCFPSVHTLNEEESKKVWEFHNKLVKATEKAMTE